MIVDVKSGAPDEADAAKPGNRGKRDSQGPQNQGKSGRFMDAVGGGCNRVGALPAEQPAAVHVCTTAGAIV